jgi:hypothetical protein
MARKRRRDKDKSDETQPQPTGTVSKKKPVDLDGGPIKVKDVRLTKKDNWHDLCLLLAYAIQCRGEAMVSDIIGDILKLNVKITRADKMISDAVEALRQAQVLKEGHNSDGARVLAMRRHTFNNNPEWAEVNYVIKQLRDDPNGELIIQLLTKDDGNSSSSGEWPDKMAMYRAHVRLMSSLLGGGVWNGNLIMQKKYFAADRYQTMHSDDSGKPMRDSKGNLTLRPEFADHTEVPNMMGRTFDGKIRAVHQASVRNTLASAAECSNPSSNGRKIKRGDIERFFLFKDVILDDVTVKIVSIERLPVTRKEHGPRGKGKGAGPAYYECIEEGTEIMLEFGAPTEHFITPQEMKTWLERILPFKGLSHARSSQGHGTSELLKLEYRLWDKWDQGWQDAGEPPQDAGEPQPNK